MTRKDFWKKLAVGLVGLPAVLMGKRQSEKDEWISLNDVEMFFIEDGKLSSCTKPLLSKGERFEVKFSALSGETANSQKGEHFYRTDKVYFRVVE